MLAPSSSRGLTARRPLIGFNLSNSVNNETIEITAADVRKALGFEDVVRIEHHITEMLEEHRPPALQPPRRADGAGRSRPEHLGQARRRRSRDRADARPPVGHLRLLPRKDEIEAAGEMPALLRNYLDKHEAVNRTARAPDRARPELHRRAKAASQAVADEAPCPASIQIGNRQSTIGGTPCHDQSPSSPANGPI